MISLDFKTATEMINGTLTDRSDPAASFRGVSIDSRTAEAGELFIAIRGAHTDGHQFVRDAFVRNVAGVVVETGRVSEVAELAQVVSVADTTQALKELASKYRRDVGATYVGITGSTGKTTVKEMIHHLLVSSGKRSYVSPGNFNNLYGLPLALLRMDQSVEVGVFELGISTPGEMAQLAPILEPKVAVITNVSATHLEFLKTVEKVREEKLQILSALQPGGIAVVPAEDQMLVDVAKKRGVSVVTFSGSADAGADVKPSSVVIESSTGQPKFEYGGGWVCLKLFGMHQVENAMCALAVCRALGIKVESDALESFTLENAVWRGEIERVSDLTLVLDCYNASPASMRAGLAAFFAIELPEDARKIVVVGDMLELGESSKREHENIGKLLARYYSREHDSGASVAALLTVGQHAIHISQAFEKDKNNNALAGNASVMHFGGSAEAGKALLEIVRPGDAVYFKASREIKLEEAITILKGGAFKLN